MNLEEKKMTKDVAVMLLKEKGFKVDRTTHENMIYMYKATEGTDCRLNERPPKLGVEIYDYRNHQSLTMKIRAESANGQWVDVGFYSMPLEEVLEIDTYMYVITKMWECAN